jgi:hypothetical protein
MGHRARRDCRRADEQTSRREPAVFVVGIDLTDELAAEEKEVTQVTTDGRSGEFFHSDEVHDEGLEFLEHLFAVGRVIIVALTE